MTRYCLTLELGGLNAPLLRAAQRLRRDPRLEVTTRFLRSPQQGPLERVLRLEPGSEVRSLLTLLWAGDDALAREPRPSEQAALGASSAVWSDTGLHESWRRTARPLPHLVCYGQPALRRPWVLVAPGLNVDSARLESITELRDAQAHYLRPTWAARHRDAVVWLPKRSIIESLLGHVDAVLAPNGPLAWDATRVGAPVFDPGTGNGVPVELGLQRLARIVPETLVTDPEFWRLLVSGLLGESDGSDWGTVPWLRLARARSINQREREPETLHLRRKLLKLHRDPRAFWADSKLAGLAKRVSERRRA